MPTAPQSSVESLWIAAMSVASRGDGARLAELCKEPPSPHAAAWHAVGSLMLEGWGRTTTLKSATVADLAALETGPSRAADLAAYLLCRRAAALHDKALIDLSVGIVAGRPPSLRRSAIALWAHYAAGRWGQLRIDADAVAKRASTDADADVRVDATALRALAALHEGAVDQGLQSARTASRMARTEGILHSEVVAAVVLARLRRASGQGIVAARIAGALAAYAPWPWRGAVEWECIMAGGPTAPQHTELIGDAATAAQQLRRFLHDASQGRASTVQITTLRTIAERSSPLALDVENLLATVQGTSPRSPDLSAWVTGERVGTAPGLPSTVAEPNVFAPGVVACHHAAPGRRVPGLVARQASRAPAIPSWDKQARLCTLLCVLGLAGPDGLSEDEAFARVYGFAYQTEVHGGRFGVLVHRARALLGELGTLHRDEGHLRLDVGDRGLLISDPRCVPQGDDRVLRYLLRHPGAKAKDVATALTMPLRSVQLSLRQLVDRELCRAEQHGRSWSYSVEDTTFQPPTAERLRAGSREN